MATGPDATRRFGLVTVDVQTADLRIVESACGMLTQRELARFARGFRTATS